MPAIFLSEADVHELLTMESAVEAVEDAFRRLASGDATNVPRHRAGAADVVLHTKSAGCAAYGLVGYKAYTSSRSGVRFHVVLYDATTGEMVAIIEADWLGQLRTGAASGVATQYLARKDAARVGIIGSGKQARTQLMAMLVVRPITCASVFSRSQERREAFAREMSERCAVEVRVSQRAEEVVEGADIVITATSSRSPVLLGRWLQQGTHINAVGSNALDRAELDIEAIRRADAIVVDSAEQAHLEAGDLKAPLDQGGIEWSAVRELSGVVAGRSPGRVSPSSITLFKSLGLAIEDLAVARVVITGAKQRGRGAVLEQL
jgi:ornithine cyclodeaminase/alanine dehydrogenase-like protein (mu-crystallin family)